MRALREHWRDAPEVMEPSVKRWMGETVRLVVEVQKGYSEQTKAALDADVSDLAQKTENTFRVFGEHVKEKIGNSDNRMAQALEKLTSAVDAMTADKGRAKISDKTRLAHMNFLKNSFYKGRCPCCQKVQILSEDMNKLIGEMDHFHGDHRNDEANVWPVCVDCSTKMDRSKNKDAARFIRKVANPAFEIYHNNYETWGQGEDFKLSPQ